MDPGDEVHTRVQVACAVLLTVGGFSSAWCAYEAALWNSAQTKMCAAATALRVESARHATRGGQQRAVDVAVFVAWAEAYASESRLLATFLQRRFRSELKPAFDEWLAAQ